MTRTRTMTKECVHTYIEYDNESMKDSEQVDGVQVSWECDDCTEKGIHHFEFDYEDSEGNMDDERYAKFTRKIMRNPKDWIGYTKKELRQELCDYAKNMRYDLTEDGFDEFDYFDDWLKNEANICDHDGFDSENFYINYNTLTLSQTCTFCGYMRDLIHNRMKIEN